MASFKEKEWIESWFKNIAGATAEDVYEKMNALRRGIVTPIIDPIAVYLKKWEEEEYKRKEFREDAYEFYTEKGERVRSKTEMLIAHMLIRYNIPYHYEQPLEIKEHVVLHPDFTIMHPVKRTLYYWEHLGMMDDKEYAESALQRIILYEMNGIYPGENLIITHETSAHPISSLLLENIIRHYFISETNR